MAGVLETIVGKRIKEFIVNEYDAHLMFGDGAILTIYNKWSLTGTHDPRLAGYRVLSLVKDAESIRLTFFPEGAFRIGMRGSDYLGPEAIQFRSADGTIYID